MCKDQESIQSSTTPDPGYQWESDKFAVRHMRSLIRAFASRLNNSITVKLLTEHHLEFLSFKGGCTGLYEPTFVKMPHFWKSHALAHIVKLLFCTF